MYLNGNELSGSIPPEIGNLSNLTNLYLYENQLTGVIPAEIANLTHLVNWWFYDNQLTGELPCTMCELDVEWNNSSYFNISGNQFCPPYPDCIPENIGEQDTTNCEAIPVRQFDLWGQCYMIENTDSLNLGNTGLTGTIPPDIGNLINLTHVYLYGNELTGEIPAEIGNLENLTHLYLYDNDLTGPLPPEIGNLTSLTHLYLYGNGLTEELPPEIGDMINLKHLFLYDNQLTEGIPPELGNLTHLNYLYLNDNQLNGDLAESVCDLNLDWSNSLHFNIFNNFLCPPYPSCMENYMGYQDTSNCSQVLTIEKQVPISYALYNAYPNPFNPVTTLHYVLPEDAMVNITIYNMMGRIVKSMVNSEQNAGYKLVQWNATNDASQPVGAGLYLYSMQAGEFRKTKKMVLLK